MPPASSAPTCAIRRARSRSSARRGRRPLWRRLRARPARLRLEDARVGRPTASSSSDAADLVASYGGSMSGEHGDGRARSELPPRMYSPEAIALMERPSGFRPGQPAQPRRACRSRPVRRGLRLAAPMEADPHDAEASPTTPARPGYAVHRLHRCRQVRRRQQARGGVIALLPGHPGREGLHSRPGARAPGRRQRQAPLVRRRRGRRGARPAPVLQGLRVGLPDRHRHGDLQVRGPPRSTPARCARAPTTPSASCLGGPADRPPKLANTMLRSRTVGRFAEASPGSTSAASCPRSSEKPSCAGGVRSAVTLVRVDPGGLFTDRFAATRSGGDRLLGVDGLPAAVIPSTACCGLTWITTGQLDCRPAHRRPGCRDPAPATSTHGRPRVGLEPRCPAAIREDAGQLVDDPESARSAPGSARSPSSWRPRQPRSVDPSRSHRRRGRGAAALPPPRRDRLETDAALLA